MNFQLPNNLKKVLIAGSTGLVSKSLKQAFESIGSKVITVSDRGDITWQDFKDKGLPSDTSAVINACGKNIFSPGLFNTGFKNELIRSRVGTTEILRDAILKSKNPPNSFLLITGVGCYKPDPNIIHNEDSQEFSHDFWNDLVNKWEMASQLPEGFPTKTVFLRSGAILSRKGGMVQNLYPQFYTGFGSWLGSGNQYMPWIHIYDLVKLFVFCCENQNMKGVVNAVSPQFTTNKEFSKSLAKEMFRPCFLNVPEFVIRNLLCEERCSILLNSLKAYPKKALDNGFEFFYNDIGFASNALAKMKNEMI